MLVLPRVSIELQTHNREAEEHGSENIETSSFRFRCFQFIEFIGCFGDFVDVQLGLRLAVTLSFLNTLKIGDPGIRGLCLGTLIWLKQARMAWYEHLRYQEVRLYASGRSGITRCGLEVSRSFRYPMMSSHRPAKRHCLLRVPSNCTRTSAHNLSWF